MMEERIYPPMHPGRVLEFEFLKPLKITPYALAKAIGVDAPRVYEIVRGRRAITADTALRLARYFGTSAEFWLNLQNHYDLEVEEGRAGESVAKIQPLAHARGCTTKGPGRTDGGTREAGDTSRANQ